MKKNRKHPTQIPPTPIPEFSLPTFVYLTYDDGKELQTKALEV